jgi:hypothetical protein
MIEPANSKKVPSPARRALRPLWIVLAILFLFEAWLWNHLERAIRWVVDLVGLPALKARVAAGIERLPPPAALLVFAIPIVLLLPLKLAGLWMLAHGSWLGAMAVLAGAKVLSMGMTAFIFEVTRPKLLQMAWFRWVYERVLAGLGWAHRQVDPMKARVKEWSHLTLAPMVRRVRSALWVFGPGRRGRFMRRALRLRRRVRHAAG